MAMIRSRTQTNVNWWEFFKRRYESSSIAANWAYWYWHGKSTLINIKKIDFSYIFFYPTSMPTQHHSSTIVILFMAQHLPLFSCIIHKDTNSRMSSSLYDIFQILWRKCISIWIHNPLWISHSLFLLLLWWCNKEKSNCY